MPPAQLLEDDSWKTLPVGPPQWIQAHLQFQKGDLLEDFWNNFPVDGYIEGTPEHISDEIYDCFAECGKLRRAELQRSELQRSELLAEASWKSLLQKYPDCEGLEELTEELKGGHQESIDVWMSVLGHVQYESIKDYNRKYFHMIQDFLECI